MKAAVVREFGKPLVIEDLVLDAPLEHEVRVAIGAVAVCGSDIHAGDGSWGGELPAVNGHEAAGVVREVGKRVSSVAPGDHVVVTLLQECGSCSYCSIDETHLCSGRFDRDGRPTLRDALGNPVFQGIRVGAFAEQVVVHESQVVAIPREIPLDRACLLACGVITGYGAVANSTAVPPGSSVVVVGLGGVGMNCLQGARAARAATIVGIDMSEAKLDRAGEFGATHARRADDPDLRKELRALTGGRGADFVFVAVGNPAAIERARDLLRLGGVLVVVGMSAAGEHFRVEASEFAASAQTLIGSRVGSARASRDIPFLAGEYLAGRLQLDELISGRFPLESANEAIASSRSGEPLRNVIVFGGEPS